MHADAGPLDEIDHDSDAERDDVLSRQDSSKYSSNIVNIVVI